MISHVTGSRIRPGLGFAEFEVTTSWGSSEIAPIVVWRRYREFDALAQQLSQVSLPSLPAKQWWGSTHSSVVAQRQRDLDYWIFSAVRVDKSKPLLNFLGVIEADIVKANAPAQQVEKPKTVEDEKKRALKNIVSTFVQRLLPEPIGSIRFFKISGEEEEDSEVLLQLRARLEPLAQNVFVVVE